MAKRQRTDRVRRCAIVTEDGAGHWVTRGVAGPIAGSSADSAQAAILRALYGRGAVGAVVLLPPKGRS
ncbi:hypothetical protein GCM10011611_41140 [Aliidongia dinghuensis]|uniref:Uncharacterized protein n=1 Tax=Aliidongia dinghuensis TaxID=1867774 RepID=A0A8J2YX93_9PROT|nr:hypothetical protein [Aliidongia dinghuensis]GGF30840.1 hypothetical protein GCM10011611_41140 [Aliidongia dinghuensis]